MKNLKKIIMVIMVSGITFTGCSQTREGCGSSCGKSCNHEKTESNSTNKDVCGNCGKSSCDKNCSTGLSSNQEKEQHIHNSSCSLPKEKARKRVKSIIGAVFSKVVSVSEIKTGYDFTFKESFKFSAELLEFVKMEQGCCGSFTYGLVFDPDKKTIHLQVYGSDEIKKEVAQMLPMLGVDHLIDSN